MGIFTAIGAAVVTSLGGALAGSTAAATALFTVSAATATVIGIGSAIFTFGGIAMSIMQMSSLKKDFGDMSPAYQGVLQTQTDQNLPVAMLYGTVKLAGNRIWQDEDSTRTVKRMVAFAEGEICGFSDIKLNDIPANQIAGIKINKYVGTQNQVVDGIVGGNTQKERAAKVGSLRNLAYLAITVPRSAEIDLNYNLTAVVKGRKIRVYENPYSYKIKYSENPAWVMFDFLTSYNGLGLGVNNYGVISDDLINDLFDLNSFIEAAQYCDELIPYTKKNSDGTVTTGNSPRFTFNMVFDAQTSARTFIDEIYRSCRGGLFVKDGRLMFKIDKPEPVSKIFKVQNILKNSENFKTIPQEEHYDILKCSYVSPDHEWQKVEATAEIPVYRSGVPIEHSVNIYSVTNFQQASRLAWYYVNSKQLQPYFGSFQTDYYGYDVEVGDVIAIDSILMGLEKYKVKVVKVEYDSAGIYTIHWRTYDERLYNDTLGSQEPRVLVSNLNDIAAYPEDVKNFNVVQVANMFNFVWQQNTNISDTYEIRVGESWQNSIVVKSKISEPKFTYEIPTNGLYKFWIKAFNGYNYSKNATLDIVNIDAVPSLNEIVKIDVLDNMQGTMESTLKAYRNTLKLKTDSVLWQTTDDVWENNSGYYQNAGRWGANVFGSGVYESQIYDIGASLESIVSFDYSYSGADEQNNVLLEWAFSDDGENFSDWKIVNNGTYQFRYCKFRATLTSVNNVQLVLTNFVVAVDVPDKDLDMNLEITDSDGLLIQYDFINVPSIVATVNDDKDAYIVVTEKTNKSALLKAYKNSGELTTCKLSVRLKGY